MISIKKDDNRKMSECKECHKERMRVRTRINSDWIFNIVGNSCTVCGYDKCSAALELHHLDPSKKDFNISKSRSYKRDKILEEIEKCVLLCSNCHREVHSGLIKIGQ